MTASVPLPSSTPPESDDVLATHRVSVMIVAYNAEKYIESVLMRIPPSLFPKLSAIDILDDSSEDRTFEMASKAAERLGHPQIHVYRTPMNRGYGGNQKIGYRHAIERGDDIVIMLHGDGQYPPEYLSQMIAPFANPEVDVVLGSRMLHRFDALRGRMPFYKWIGNQILTAFENYFLGVHLSEFHTGYRAYRISALREIPFIYNSDGFHFDTEILIQCIARGGKIVEIPIPTHYGDEVCHVPGLAYAWNCIKAVIKYRLFRMGLFYNPFLDFHLFEEERYYLKQAPNSLHQYVLRHFDVSGKDLLSIGDTGGYLSEALAERARSVVAVHSTPPRYVSKKVRWQYLDLEQESTLGCEECSKDLAVVLDGIEHSAMPEALIRSLARVIKPGGMVIAATGNIAFFITRLMLFLGYFNYSKRGILDLTHKRLFALYSFRALFETYGFEIEQILGFGPPIRDLISTKGIYGFLDTLFALLARFWPSLFGYTLLVVARRKPLFDEVYALTLASKAPLSTSPASPAETRDPFLSQEGS